MPACQHYLKGKKTTFSLSMRGRDARLLALSERKKFNLSMRGQDAFLCNFAGATSDTTLHWWNPKYLALNLTHVSRLLYLHYVSVRQQDLHSTELSHYASWPLWFLLSFTSKTYTLSIYSKSWVPCVFKVHCCIQSDLTLRLGLKHTLQMHYST